MPSILIFCKTLLKGGAEKQALTLSKLLVEKSTNVLLICWCGNKIDSANMDFMKNNSIRYIGLTGNPLKKYIAFLRIVRKEKSLIVLSYLTKPNLVVGTAKFFIRNLVTIGGIRTEKLPYYKFFIEKLVHNYLNDVTVFNNYSGREKFEKRGFNPMKINVIHNTIHVPLFEENKQSIEEIRIVSVCRFVKSKDFRTALYSFQYLVEKNRDKKLKFLIIGYGPLENGIRLLVKELKLETEVEIMINPPDIPGILKTCNIYLSTSLYEGLSNSIMEAMVAGLPIVATNVGDNMFLIHDEYNGFIVPCGDINIIVEKLDYLLEFENVRNEFGYNSHSIIESDFSEKKFIENYFQLFSKLTAS